MVNKVPIGLILEMLMKEPENIPHMVGLNMTKIIFLILGPFSLD